jgi:hypothetical protein
MADSMRFMEGSQQGLAIRKAGQHRPRPATLLVVFCRHWTGCSFLAMLIDQHRRLINDLAMNLVLGLSFALSLTGSFVAMPTWFTAVLSYFMLIPLWSALTVAATITKHIPAISLDCRRRRCRAVDRSLMSVGVVFSK